MKSCTSLVYTIPPSISTCPIISTSQRLTLFHKPQQSFPPFLLSQFSFNYSPTNLRPISPLYATATEEVAETHESCSEFIEVGYVYSVHGLQGQVRIKSDTDFPELRFSQPGKRWLRQEVSGLEVVQEMELVEGIGHPGQKGWIVKFNGIDTVEEAQKLIGSTVLVVDEDRPVLEDDEFYTRDLVGLRVILKETGEPVGVVVNVFDSGANDLLHVKLNSSVDISQEDENLKLGLDKSGPLVWIPFVEAIVPDVDLNKGEMLITPPKGLLELNIRSDEKSKKERRQLEWKERKKFQKRLIAAKKKLCEMEQQHVFHGFRCGEKDQRSALANQIVSVNSKLLQQAMLSTETQPKRSNFGEFISSLHIKNKIIKDFSSDGTGEHTYLEFKSIGNSLAHSGKLACVLASEDWTKFSRQTAYNEHDYEVDEEDSCLLVKTLLNEESEFIKIDHRPSVPLVLIVPTNSIGTLQQLFVDHDYFAFSSEKFLLSDHMCTFRVSMKMFYQSNFFRVLCFFSLFVRSGSWKKRNFQLSVILPEVRARF
ncbi:hypothetical protein Leryth_024542 [Lithospermum erythrorhizon]|nr:hypothetical protein Leryth_024542 [Lithospermum erythrorhizon]